MPPIRRMKICSERDLKTAYLHIFDSDTETEGRSELMQETFL